MRKTQRRRRDEVWMQVRDGGKPLKRKRERAGYTQRELAFLVGKTDTTIWMLETGRLTSCSEQLATTIAKRLDCDLEDLFLERRPTTLPVTSNVTLDMGRAAA